MSDSIRVLLASDDKQYALLVVFLNTKPEDKHKLILFVPKSEVKWMTVTDLVPLLPFLRNSTTRHGCWGKKRGG